LECKSNVFYLASQISFEFRVAGCGLRVAGLNKLHRDTQRLWRGTENRCSDFRITYNQEHTTYNFTIRQVTQSYTEIVEMHRENTENKKSHCGSKTKMAL